MRTRRRRTVRLHSCPSFWKHRSYQINISKSGIPCVVYCLVHCKFRDEFRHGNSSQGSCPYRMCSIGIHHPTPAHLLSPWIRQERRDRTYLDDSKVRVVGVLQAIPGWLSIVSFTEIHEYGSSVLFRSILTCIRHGNIYAVCGQGHSEESREAEQPCAVHIYTWKFAGDTEDRKGIQLFPQKWAQINSVHSLDVIL